MYWWWAVAGNVLHQTYPLEYQTSSSQPRQSGVGPALYVFSLLGYELRGFIFILECWPDTTSAWAGWRRIDISVNRYGGVHSLPPRTSCTYWVSLPANRLASRKILIKQNIKRRAGPELYVFSLLGYVGYGVYVLYSVGEQSQSPSLTSIPCSNDALLVYGIYIYVHLATKNMIP